MRQQCGQGSVAWPPGGAEEVFVHPALRYRGEEEYLAATVPFISDGLAANEPVAVAVPTGNLSLLRSELGSRADEVRLVNMTEAGRNPGRIIPSVLRAFADAYPDRHVRIISEPIWPERTQTEYPACVQHEALINHSFTGLRVSILCPYDAKTLGSSVLRDVARTHPLLIDASGRRHSDLYAPDEVVAEYNRPLPPLPNAEVLTVNAPDLSQLRRCAADVAYRNGMSDERAYDVVLALTELAANSIEHARSAATVSIGVDGAQLVCQVQDTGHLTDPLVGRRPGTLSQLRGRGLLMVNQLADLVRMHTAQRATTIEIRFGLS